MCHTNANNISFTTRNEELEGVPLLPVEFSQLMWSSLPMLSEHKNHVERDILEDCHHNPLLTLGPDCHCA